jgi:uncharacterized membrane protein YbhN (UPF0104 family)
VPSALARTWRRRRTRATLIVSLAASAALVAVLIGRWHELAAGMTAAPITVIALAVGLQVVALVSRTEAWHVSVEASGGTVERRRLYRASSLGGLGTVLSSQLGTATRIAVLRRSAPEKSPRVSTLVAAELPILAVEASLAAIFSFTLVVPLGLPWWLPLAAIAAVVGVSLALRKLGRTRARWLHEGLAVMRSLHGRSRLVGFVLVAVAAQIMRNWLLLHAVGFHASLFDAIAVLIAVVTLGQLPFGLSTGAAASVLILGPQGVSLAAAAGVLLTATGTVGALCFAAWGAIDAAAGQHSLGGLALRLRGRNRWLRRPAATSWAALAALPLNRRRSVERSYFGGLTHLQITRVLGLTAA